MLFLSPSFPASSFVLTSFFGVACASYLLVLCQVVQVEVSSKVKGAELRPILPFPGILFFGAPCVRPVSSLFSKLFNLGFVLKKVWNYGQFQPPRGRSFWGHRGASYLPLLFKSHQFNVSFKVTHISKKRRSHA